MKFPIPIDRDLPPVCGKYPFSEAHSTPTAAALEIQFAERKLS